jgi:translation initiation factor 4G
MTDGTTLKSCVDLIFEKATKEANSGNTYALLCQKLVKNISNDIKDASVNSAGGKLFLHYLADRCREDSNQSWKNKVKQMRLSAIRFMGELFKVDILRNCTMHLCIKQPLTMKKKQREKKMEGACVLMRTIGSQLDQPTMKVKIGEYLNQMEELSMDPGFSSNIRSMIQDIIELRANGWIDCHVETEPVMITATHEEAVIQQGVQEMMCHSTFSGSGASDNSNHHNQLNPSGVPNIDHKQPIFESTNKGKRKDDIIDPPNDAGIQISRDIIV